MPYKTRVALNKQGIIIIFYRKWNEYHQLKTGFFAHKRRVSAFNTAEFVSDMMS
jgi:hypothetical protein